MSPKPKPYWPKGTARDIFALDRAKGEPKPTGNPRLPLIGERVEYRGGLGSPVYRGVATGEPCDDETCSDVHVVTEAGGLHHVEPSFFLRPGALFHWAREIR